DRVAAVYRDESISYRQLNSRANRLAYHLQASGVGPESLVALLDARGINYLVAILGVFKAGAAYLPLDPAHPDNRLRQVLDQSGSELVLVGSQHYEKLSSALNGSDSSQRPKVISLDEIMCRQGPESGVTAFTAANSLSYVFYTSGSTGMPKGAMIEQS